QCYCASACGIVPVVASFGRRQNSPTQAECIMARSATATKAKTQANVPQFTGEQDLEAYREMLLIRRFEEKAGQMYGMGLIGGFCHLYIGQEAVVTGITMASEKGKDAQITGYRDH